MSGECVDSTSQMAGDRAIIPPRIRRELDIRDGDTLQWKVQGDDTLRVRVVRQRSGTFEEFDGYDGDAETAVSTEHDAWSADLE